MDLHLDSQDYLDQDQLNYLLDYSQIVQNESINQSLQISISKDKLNFSEKERTREQTYQEICKQINQAKLEQVQLNQQLSELKQITYKKYLGPFRQEFLLLNKQNLQLRAQLNQYRTKIKEDNKQRLSHRSSVNPRISKNSIVGDYNNKTNTKTGRKETSPNLLRKKQQIKIVESSANLGRSQIVSPRVHRRRQSQLTERKMQQNQQSVGVSMNASYYDQKNTETIIRQSVSKAHLKQYQGNKNVFVQILQRMLVQQKIRDNEKYCQLYLQANESKSIQKTAEQARFINQLQEEIEVSNQKLQMLTLVINKYQSQMQGMDRHLKNVQQIYKKLYAVKGRFVEMEKKCIGLVHLRKEISEKQQFLNKKKDSLLIENNQGQNKSISSVQTLLKIMSNNPNKLFKGKPSSLYFTYYKQIKAIFNQNIQEQTKQKNKLLKVRELIQTIRQGRKKFNQLILIYQTRITKLEEKIKKMKGQQLLRSDKSSRK